jgi:hypothetical protein
MRCSASTPVSPACWLCILPSRPMTAFGPDDRAKVSALTSGADLRSTGPTTLSSQVAPPCQHEELALFAGGPLARPARVGHRRLGSGWPRCAGCPEPVRSSARRQAPRQGQPDCGVALPSLCKPSSLGLMVREAEVLALVAEGRTNRQIGQALFITPKDRRRPRLKDPGQAGGRRARGGGCDRPPARPRQAMTGLGRGPVSPRPV